MIEILPQLLIISLISSSIYLLIAAGLTLTFSTLEFINFAHGETAMVGAYLFFTFYVGVDMPLLLAIMLSALCVSLIGIIIEKATFKPVRNKQEYIPLVLSIGVSIFLQAIITMIYGSSSRSFSKGSTPTVYTFFDGAVTITLTQILIIITALTLTALLILFLKKSKTGKAIRAVSDDKQVAAIMGIDVNRTMSILFALASGLAAFGGILAGFDQNLYPKMGILLSLKAFAVIILGGVGKLKGAIIAAFIIGFSENLITGLTPIPSSFKETIVFLILIAVLLFRPYGIFGGNKEEVESR